MLAGDDVVGANIAGRREIVFAGRRAQDDQVLENASRIVGLNPRDRLRIAAQAFAKIDQPVLPERQNRLAGAGVDLLKVSC